MNTQTICTLLSVVALAATAPLGRGQTAFTYQGKLVDDCCPATGLYDLRLRLWTVPVGGAAVGAAPTLTLPAVPVSNGLFSASLDFGSAAFDGSARWLEIEVRTNNTGSFVALAPRTELTPTPYAIHAQRAATVPDNAITGPKIAQAQVVRSLNGLKDNVTLTAGANVTLTPSGNSLQISAPAVGLGLPYSSSASSATPLFALNNTGAGSAMKLTGNASGGFPNAVLHIDGGNANRGIYAYDVTGDAILGDSWSGRAISGYSGGGGVGVYGVSLSNKGVFGLGDYGVWGQSDNSGGRGVMGKVTGGGDAVGVYGQNETAGTYGQLGTPDYGVLASGGTGWGFYAEADNGSPLPGLRPKVYLAGGSAAGSKAARFEGLVELAGKLGIGTATPGAPLQVEGAQAYERLVSTSTLNGSVLELWNLTTQPIGGPPVTLGAINFGNGSTTPGQIAYLANQNNHGMSFRVAGVEQMTVGSDGNVSVGSLTIRGGADLAEPFQMSGERIAEGSVVVIDEENPGRLKEASRAYDTRVAGIVSGANGVKAGVSLHQEGVLEGGQNVALTGRVYVKADAAFGRIMPGDLLTTSDRAGHAMRVSDPARSQGAILGKAMTGLVSGQGMVLVLVSLQ